MNKNYKRKSSSRDSSSSRSRSCSSSYKSNSQQSLKMGCSSQDLSSDRDDDFSRSANRKKSKRDRSDSLSALALKVQNHKKPYSYKGITIDYNEPPEAKQPNKRWRLCPVKHNESLQTHGKSVYLIGRLRKLVDIPINHPTCSKQHAALQYRLVNIKKNDGTICKTVRPYLIDLDSVNGTYVNDKKIEPRKYVELHEKDVIKFGNSLVEYVLLYENKGKYKEDDDYIHEVENLSVKKEVVN